ncbi:MAG TPA: M20/M25/M40 family metallo-hydrolase [Gemmatimonadaceae bacterium]|nr:M20/M25/M40 family metallo-hydrolase [Gemmatimonadaceae bacterium]
MPRSVIVAAALLLTAPPLAAQDVREAPDASPAARAVASWLALDAPPGEETRAAAAIRAADPRWRADDLGDLALTVGSGRPRRLVACGLDHPTLVVSQITDDGYLRLHRAGNAATHPLWDQFHEAQQIAVLTRDGRVPGVVGAPNGHFARQHRGDSAVVTADQLWVDVGARTRAEAEGLGVALLDPVVRLMPPWPYADQVAGPDAGGRAACAAVATAARETPERGTTTFLLSAQRSFNWAGLGAAAARLGPFDEITLVAPAERRRGRGGADAADDESGADVDAGPAVYRRRVARPSSVPASAAPDSVTRLEPRLRFAGSLVETIAAADADALLAAVREAAGVGGASPARWLALDVRPTPVAAPPRDSLSAVADLLTTLVELPGVPGHEAPVRDAVRAALPEWARAGATVDDAGNLIVAAGPERDTVVVVAHLDEVGYAVRSIERDGTVTLTGRGGVIPSAWEGQPALLQLDAAGDGDGSAPAQLRGVFVPRATATRRRPDEVRAWFGLDSAALVAAGARVGSGVTGYKEGHRLAATRFAARSLDDRAGSTALALALHRVDPDALPHRVLFVWSTGEEGGLVGARALAARIGPQVRRTYAVDTFVSSDTPLESPHFAHAPLGAGPVLRGLDDGLIAPPVERARVLAVARAAGVPLQVGTTQGSTDATPFVAAGAPGMGLSWPGRYSHSPAEVLDLRDLAALVRLVSAVAAAPAR